MVYADQDSEAETGKALPSSDKTLGSRIKSVLSEIGEERSVQATGKSWKSLSRYAAGFEPPLGVIVSLANEANVHINWLATGAEPRDSSTPVRQIGRRTQPEHRESPMLRTVDPSSFENNGLVRVPRLDVQGSAGSGREPTGEQQMELLAFHEGYLRDLGINPRAAHVIQVTGLSMYPTLHHEDLVLVDTSIDEVRDEALYAVVYGGLVLIKRVRIARDGSITLSSDNKAEGYTDEIIKPADLDDLHIAGRVCGRVSKM